MKKSSAQLTKALKAYAIIKLLIKKPIIYGSIAATFYTNKKLPMNDIDILVRKRDLELLAAKLPRAKYNAIFDTVHVKIAGIKVELDARERWAPKNLSTTSKLVNNKIVTITTKKSLIWFYKKGTKASHKRILKILRT